MQRIGTSFAALTRQECQASGITINLQRVQQALFSGTHAASQKKENIGQNDKETTKGVAAGENSTKSPGGAPETPETTSQAPGGSVRPGYDPAGKDKGQHSATQETQNPQSGGEPKEADIGSGKGKGKTPFYTTASAAWKQGGPRASFSNSPALAKGLWGQSRPLSTSSVLLAYQRPGDRSDTGSGQGGMNEGHSDPNTGSGTGGGSPGLPLDVDPKDATSTDRIDDPEQLFKRRRAKDPVAFDKVHGKGATLHGATDGHKQESSNQADKMTNQDASKHLGGREGKKQTMGTNTKQAASFFTWTRGFLSSATARAGNEEGQKKSGNPFAPTSSAGGTPTDNEKDEDDLPNEAKQVQMSGKQKETPTQPGSDRMPKNSGRKDNVQTGNSVDKDNAVAPEGVGGP